MAVCDGEDNILGSDARSSGIKERQRLSRDVVEQNARAALAVSDRGYVLAEGREQIEGGAGDLLADPEVGALYLGARRALA